MTPQDEIGRRHDDSGLTCDPSILFVVLSSVCHALAQPAQAMTRKRPVLGRSTLRAPVHRGPSDSEGMHAISPVLSQKWVAGQRIRRIAVRLCPGPHGARRDKAVLSGQPSSASESANVCMKQFEFETRSQSGRSGAEVRVLASPVSGGGGESAEPTRIGAGGFVEFCGPGTRRG